MINFLKKYEYIPSWNNRYGFDFDNNTLFFVTSNTNLNSSNTKLNVYALYPEDGYTSYGIRFSPYGPGTILALPQILEDVKELEKNK